MFTRVPPRIAAMLFMVAAFSAVFVTAPASAADEPSLGGSPKFPPQSTFPFPAGTDSTFRTSVMLQNTWSQAAEIQVSDTAPSGVTITVGGGSTLTLAPEEVRDVEFDISVAKSVAPGRYPVLLTFAQTNAPRPEDGNVAFAPGITVGFDVLVSGRATPLTVTAVAADDEQPVEGEMTLDFLGDKGPIPVARVTGSQIKQAAMPGRYQASFTIQGLAQESVEFEVEEGTPKDVVIKVATVQFSSVFAEPVTVDGAVVEADLKAVISSSLREVAGPLTLSVRVDRDGERVDEAVIATLPALPKGETTQLLTYRPAEGFTEGVWSFTYHLDGRFFDIDSRVSPRFAVPGSSVITPVLVTLTAAVVVAGGWWFLVARRRRDEDEDRS